MPTTDEPEGRERRRPTVRTLRQPVRPVTMHARLGTHGVLDHADVVSLTDRTIVVEVGDSALALALSLAPEVTVVLDLGGGEQRLVARPGRRASDNPTSRRVELVLDTAPTPP